MMEERKFSIEHFSRTVSNDENIWRMKEERKKWNLYNEESRQHSIFNKRYLKNDSREYVETEKERFFLSRQLKFCHIETIVFWQYTVLPIAEFLSTMQTIATSRNFPNKIPG